MEMPLQGALAVMVMHECMSEDFAGPAQVGSDSPAKAERDSTRMYVRVVSGTSKATFNAIGVC